MERDGKKALLSARPHEPANVEERRRAQPAVDSDAYASGLLDDVDPSTF
jgi:hypothetical protein